MKHLLTKLEMYKSLILLIVLIVIVTLFTFDFISWNLIITKCFGVFTWWSLGLFSIILLENIDKFKPKTKSKPINEKKENREQVSKRLYVITCDFEPHNPDCFHKSFTADNIPDAIKSAVTFAETNELTVHRMYVKITTGTESPCSL